MRKKGGENTSIVEGLDELDILRRGTDIEFIVKIPRSVNDIDADLIYKRCQLFVETELPRFCNDIKEGRFPHVAHGDMSVEKHIQNLRRLK